MKWLPKSKSALPLVVLRVLCAVLCAASCALAAPPAELEKARDLYQKTAYEQVVQMLNQAQETRPEAYALLGKAYFMMGDYGKATQALEQATQRDPRNADYFDWLGRIYGRRAETSSVLTAWSYARKCRSSFERALEIDSKNLETIDDLFEFALNAPGFVGGGMDRAEQLAESARELNSEKYHSLQARLADKRKDYAAEEQHLRQAIEAAPAHVGRVLDLAQFFALRKRFDESDAMFDRAKAMAPDSAQVKFKRAKTYIQTGRNKQEASLLLKQYLASELTPDDPPRAEAERMLKENST